jgi:hypothetical protein
MSVFKEIVQATEQGKPIPIKQKGYTWAALARPEREQLFALAEKKLAEPSGLELTKAIYGLAREEEGKTGEYWATMQALALVIRRPGGDPVQKQKALKAIQGFLEQTRNSLTGATGAAANAQRYRQFEADYQALNAGFLAEGGELERALHSYQQAAENYRQIGQIEQATAMDELQTQLREAQARGDRLLPFDLLQSDYAKLQVEHLRARTELQQEQQALDELRQAVQAATTEKTRLVAEAVSFKKAYEAAQSVYTDLERQIEARRSELEQLDVAVQFLMVLRQAAMAPLWLEVARLALDDGQVDDVMWQAIERLAPQLPDEGPALLAEAAARLPEPYRIKPEQLAPATNHWMARIAEARLVMDSDRLAAAQALVAGWDAFFSMTADGQNHA